MSRFVICEPGDGVSGGIFQGICLGLFFCWGGGSNEEEDLPVSEIIFFPTRREAEESLQEMVAIARQNDTSSVPILEACEVVEVTPTTDLVSLAKEWAAKHSPLFSEEASRVKLKKRLPS
jgi:hypothetical protein